MEIARSVKRAFVLHTGKDGYIEFIYQFKYVWTQLLIELNIKNGKTVGRFSKRRLESHVPPPYNE